MAQRLNQCPKCKSTLVSVLKIHNPDTHDMNANATLKCISCLHEWEDKITSPYQVEMRCRGLEI